MRNILLGALILPQILLAQLQITNQSQKSDNYFPIVHLKSVATIFYDSMDFKVVDKVSNLLASDIKIVSGQQPQITSSTKKLKGNHIIVGTIGIFRIQPLLGL